MPLTDEQLAALGLSMPPPDVTMQPGPPPATILPAQPVAPQMGAKILPDAMIPKSKMAEAYKAGGVSPADSYEAAMPKIAPDPTAPPGTYDWQKQRGEQIASRIEQMDFKKAHPWGSPESTHPGVLGKIAHGLVTAGNIAGDIFAPGTMALIPGTQLHNDIAHSNLESELGQSAEAGSKAQQDQANLEHTQAETDALKNPKAKDKEEEWDVVPNFAGPNGEPILKEKNSGQMKFATGLPGATSTKTPQKPDNPEQQFVDEYQKAHPGSSVADAQRAFKKNDTVNEPGNFMPLYDGTGRVTGAWDPKSGRIVKPPDAAGTTTGGHAIADKAASAATKEAQPYQQMVDNATEAHNLADMATKGNAPADVDLVLSFFKMMKGMGGAGVRFTKQEQDLILGARSAGQGLVAIGQKVIGEGQPLTPEQRTNMVAVMDLHAKAAQQHLDSMKGADTGNSKSGPAVGAIENGFRFKGGDPGKKENWEKQ